MIECLWDVDCAEAGGVGLMGAHYLACPVAAMGQLAFYIRTSALPSVKADRQYSQPPAPMLPHR